MPISQSLLPEFDHEMANTRKTLERVPEDKFGWKPHEKSMTLGRLAQHIAEMAGWVVETMNKESLDLQPPGAPAYQPPKLESKQQLMEMFDKNVAAAREQINSADDAAFRVNWSLLMGGTPMFTMRTINRAILRLSVTVAPTGPKTGLPSASRIHPCLSAFSGVFGMPKAFALTTASFLHLRGSTVRLHTRPRRPRKLSGKTWCFRPAGSSRV